MYDYSNIETLTNFLLHIWQLSVSTQRKASRILPPVSNLDHRVPFTLEKNKLQLYHYTYIN